jgi:hypothetical protein
VLQRRDAEAPSFNLSIPSTIHEEHSVHERPGPLAAGFDRIFGANDIDDELRSSRAASLASGRGSMISRRFSSVTSGRAGSVVVGARPGSVESVGARSSVTSARPADFAASGRRSLNDAAAAAALAAGGKDAGAAFSSVDDDDDAASVDSDTPLDNTHHALEFAAPLLYRKRSPRTARFWLQDVLLPVLVLALGVFASVCALVGVAQDIAADVVDARAEPK